MHARLVENTQSQSQQSYDGHSGSCLQSQIAITTAFVHPTFEAEDSMLERADLVCMRAD